VIVFAHRSPMKNKHYRVTLDSV